MPAAGARARRIALGEWGLRFVRSNFEHQDLDPSLLLWDIRRNIAVEYLPKDRVVIQFVFPDRRGAERNWWLLKEPGAEAVDLCRDDPGHGVDLVVSAGLADLTKIWLGELDIDVALRSGALRLDGSAALRLSLRDWFSLSMFAYTPR